MVVLVFHLACFGFLLTWAQRAPKAPAEERT